jgi:hypothetical protein
LYLDTLNKALPLDVSKKTLEVGMTVLLLFVNISVISVLFIAWIARMAYEKFLMRRRKAKKLEETNPFTSRSPRSSALSDIEMAEVIGALASRGDDSDTGADAAASLRAFSSRPEGSVSEELAHALKEIGQLRGECKDALKEKEDALKENERLRERMALEEQTRGAARDLSTVELKDYSIHVGDAVRADGAPHADTHGDSRAESETEWINPLRRKRGDVDAVGFALGSTARASSGGGVATAEGADEVGFLLCTVTFYANLAHSLTCSP